MNFSRTWIYLNPFCQVKTWIFRKWTNIMHNIYMYMYIAISGLTLGQVIHRRDRDDWRAVVARSEAATDDHAMLQVTGEVLLCCNVTPTWFSCTVLSVGNKHHSNVI